MLAQGGRVGAQPRVQVTEKKKAVTLCNQATSPKQRQGRLAVQGLGRYPYTVRITGYLAVPCGILTLSTLAQGSGPEGTLAASPATGLR